MASMTDVIFLLLIFFMVTSTVVIPNAIKGDASAGTETNCRQAYRARDN